VTGMGGRERLPELSILPVTKQRVHKVIQAPRGKGGVTRFLTRKGRTLKSRNGIRGKKPLFAVGKQAFNVRQSSVSAIWRQWGLAIGGRGGKRPRVNL